MKIAAKIMYGLTVYLIVSSVIYVFATMHVRDDGYFTKYEWAGGVGVIFSAIMTLMLGGYFHFTANRIDILPQDWEEAEVEDGEGTYGFFSPSSIWPIVMTGSIFVLGAGIIYMYYWVIVFGAILLIWSTIMLNLQYGIPKERH